MIDLARNYGQTSAMMAGFAHARGDIIVPMDADLQNDPADCAGPRSTSLSGKACVSSMRAAESARTHFLRRFIVIDVVTLAMLDTPRIMAGALVFHLVLTFWMLAFCTFIFLSLALAKRYTELWRARSRRDGAHAHGRGYDLQDMAMIASFGTASGYI